MRRPAGAVRFRRRRPRARRATPSSSGRAGRAAALDATHIDLLSLVPKDFRKLYGEQYIKLVEKLPQLWSFLYSKTDRPSRDSLVGKLKRAAEKLNTRKLDAEIERLAPDVILCTHFLPAELLSRQKARRAGALPPLWVQVTDFDVHALWVHPHVDRYCVANEEVAFRLADRGVPREKISVTGIPVMPQFSAPLDRADVCARARAAPDKFTVLMMAGGAGVGSLDDARGARVAAAGPSADSSRSPGATRNCCSACRRSPRQHPGKLFPLGFTTTVERVMTAADLVVTKPGGLSVSECLAKQRPMLLVSPIPGPGRAQRGLSTRVRRRHQGRGWRHARVQAGGPAGRARAPARP